MIVVSVHSLSKSRFMAGLHCERRLWLLVDRPEDKREPVLAQRHRMQADYEATRPFCDGIEIEEDDRCASQLIRRKRLHPCVFPASDHAASCQT